MAERASRNRVGNTISQGKWARKGLPIWSRPLGPCSSPGGWEPGLAGKQATRVPQFRPKTKTIGIQIGQISNEKVTSMLSLRTISNKRGKRRGNKKTKHTQRRQPAARDRIKTLVSSRNKCGLGMRESSAQPTKKMRTGPRKAPEENRFS